MQDRGSLCILGFGETVTVAGASLIVVMLKDIVPAAIMVVWREL